jgi:hypothetical protein
VITSGLFVVPGIFDRDLMIQGAGVSADVGISSLSPVAAYQQCSIRCEPGTTVGLYAYADGLDVRGDVTYLGESFVVGGANPRFIGNMIVEFSGHAVLPPLIGSTAEVTAPFLFEGSIWPPVTSTLPAGTLTGGGLATLVLRAQPVPSIGPGWTFQRLEYLFIEDPSVVPEPASLLLVGSGIAVLLKTRRVRRTSSRLTTGDMR